MCQLAARHLLSCFHCCHFTGSLFLEFDLRMVYHKYVSRKEQEKSKKNRNFLGKKRHKHKSTLICYYVIIATLFSFLFVKLYDCTQVQLTRCWTESLGFQFNSLKLRINCSVFLRKLRWKYLENDSEILPCLCLTPNPHLKASCCDVCGVNVSCKLKCWVALLLRVTSYKITTPLW